MATNRKFLYKDDYKLILENFGFEEVESTEVEKSVQRCYVLTIKGHNGLYEIHLVLDLHPEYQDEASFELTSKEMDIYIAFSVETEKEFFLLLKLLTGKKVKS